VLPDFQPGRLDEPFGVRPARTADVIRGGFVARLADAGLCGCAPQVPELARAQARAGLASLACCAAVFLGVGGAIWSQLVIGWQWSAPATAGTVVATFVMTGTVLVLALLTLLAALPVAWAVATRLAADRARRGTNCRWWSCCTPTEVITPTRWPGCHPPRPWR
jgi:hypothetical protein